MQNNPRFAVIPAVDVLAGGVVRLRQGDYDKVTEYAPDPVAAARRWVDEGASVVHVVDLEGARSGRPDPELWERLALGGIPFQVGGGIRDRATAGEALERGAARVILGTATVRDPGLVGDLVEEFGNERVAASVDVRDGLVAGAGWLERGKPLTQVLDELPTGGWIFVTAIARDGTLAGPDVALVREVAAARPQNLIAAAGGISQLEHLTDLAAAGAAGAIVGRALYEGVFTLGAALAAVSP